MISFCAKQFSRRMIIRGIGIIAVCSMPALSADSITGVVRNQTRGQFAAGAEVILLRPIPSGPEPARSGPIRSAAEYSRGSTHAYRLTGVV
jgi:hypothetical protein